MQELKYPFVVSKPIMPLLSVSKSASTSIGVDLIGRAMTAPRETTPDTDASIYFCAVTRGGCPGVRPIVSFRFTADTMSAPCGAARGSITDFKSQIALFTFLGTVDSSVDPTGAFGRF